MLCWVSESSFHMLSIHIASNIGGCFMDGVFKGMLLILLLIYVLSPVDLCPGPIDDIILILCTVCSRSIKANDE